LSRDKHQPPVPSDELDRFLQAVEQHAPPAVSSDRGRLIFALDATASRAPTWDRACQLQGDMFTHTDGLNGLDVQLVYYRGYDECRASRWHSDARSLLAAMSSVECRSGATQIHRMLRHAASEARRGPVAALAFVGDCCEEPLADLAREAGELRLLGVPAFVFQEGDNPTASRIFGEIARLSGGAHCRFDQHSASQLGALLNAAAVFAAGGRNALAEQARLTGGAAQQLLEQL
jgi:hypothetical protein